jgi:outer membrane protein assembly factor BamE (lipoprotein component of BamABCDE complex)
MKSFLRSLSVVLLAASFLGATACNRNSAVTVSVSKLTASNYDSITPGMSKTQVESILGRPTTIETKDMVLFKKTTYKYEEGTRFAMITFKNDEVDSKDGNILREP